MTELECWQSRFDPTWYLIIRKGGVAIDSALETHQQAILSDNNAMPLKNVQNLRPVINSAKERVKLNMNLDAVGLLGTTETSVHSRQQGPWNMRGLQDC